MPLSPLDPNDPRDRALVSELVAEEFQHLTPTRAVRPPPEYAQPTSGVHQLPVDAETTTWRTGTVIAGIGAMLTIAVAGAGLYWNLKNDLELLRVKEGFASQAISDKLSTIDGKVEKLTKAVERHINKEP